jgi:hypothetical protein
VLAMIAMKDFAFKVAFVAVVRVRAGHESVARQVVPAVVEAPGALEIALANENNAATGHDAQVTDVSFSVVALTPINGGGVRHVNMKDPTAPAPAARPRRK